MKITLQRWRMKFHDGFEYIPIPLQKSLSYAHEDFYPNIKRIFIILLTLTVTSVCCERSFSPLRRLKTWETATMDEERLCGLAMLHVHRDMNVSKGNNKITELRTILQRESQNSYVYKQTKSVNNRKTVKTVMTLTKKIILDELWFSYSKRLLNYVAFQHFRY